MILTRKRIITSLSAVLALAVAIAAVYFIYRSVYSATIYLYFAPKDSQVKIGDGGGHFGDNYVRPGTYTVVISKGGFASHTAEVTVKGGETAVVETVLNPTSSQTANWYQEHPDDLQLAQEIGDRKAAQDQDKFAKDFPIAKDLPIIGPYNSYRVDYGPSTTKAGKSAVFVRYQSDSAKQLAVKAIIAKGYNPEDYEVVYTFSGPTDGSTSFEGITVLSDRGVDSDVLDDVQTALSKKYPKSTLTFAESASHSQSSDGTVHTYKVNFRINGEAPQSLTITVTTMTDLRVQVNGQTIYTGTVTY